MCLAAGRALQQAAPEEAVLPPAPAPSPALFHDGQPECLCVDVRAAPGEPMVGYCFTMALGASTPECNPYGQRSHCEKVVMQGAGVLTQQGGLALECDPADLS